MSNYNKFSTFIKLFSNFNCQCVNTLNVFLGVYFVSVEHKTKYSDSGRPSYTFNVQTKTDSLRWRLYVDRNPFTLRFGFQCVIVHRREEDS